MPELTIAALERGTFTALIAAGRQLLLLALAAVDEEIRAEAAGSEGATEGTPPAHQVRGLQVLEVADRARGPTGHRQ